jgi:hypothetical protein
MKNYTKGITDFPPTDVGNKNDTRVIKTDFL